MFKKSLWLRLVGARQSVVGVGVCMLMVLAACGTDDGETAAGGDEGVRPVHVVLDFSAKGYSSPFFLAQEKGFFADEGLAPQISLGFGSSSTVARIGTGEGEFGFAGVNETMLGITEGLPVVGIASIIHRDMEAVFIGPDSPGATDLEDLLVLRGVKDPDEDPSDMYLGAALAQAGHDVNDIDWVSVHDAGFPMVLAGEADFDLSWISDIADWWLADPPIEPQYLWFGPELDVYGNGLITRRDILEEDPELVRSFVRAVMRAYAYVINGGQEAQQESIDALFKFNPNFLEQPNAEEFHMANLQMVLSAILSEDEIRENGIGYLLPEKAERTVGLVNDLILDQPLDVDQVYELGDQPLEAGDFVVDDFDAARAQFEQILGKPNPVYQVSG